MAPPSKNVQRALTTLGTIGIGCLVGMGVVGMVAMLQRLMAAS